jgi:hypothetical protein
MVAAGVFFAAGQWVRAFFHNQSRIMTNPPKAIWRPRSYQGGLWSYLERGGKRAVAVWHRRAGKDEVSLYWTARSAILRPGNYWHLLPEAAQARKAIWDSVNPHTGIRRIDEIFPPSLRHSTRDEDMRIRLLNDSVWQVVGSDNFNSLVGASPAGLVFSEFALADPSAWDYLRPILAENGGWAVFLFTPRGRNHAYELFQMARQRPDWFSQRMGVGESRAIGPDVIDAERATGMSEDMIRQEYFCSFNAATPGAYYARLLAEADDSGRIGQVKWDPKLPVTTAWDLGFGDSTSIWFCQVQGQSVHLIDFCESFGVGLDFYVGELRRRPYSYGEHILPHDAMVADLSTGKTRLQTLAGMGMDARVLPRERNVADGIEAVRALLPRCWFDQEACARGIEALRQYRSDYDSTRRIYSPRPRHDWASHAADAFRYLARGLPDPAPLAASGERRSGRRARDGSWMSL